MYNNHSSTRTRRRPSSSAGRSSGYRGGGNNRSNGSRGRGRGAKKQLDSRRFVKSAKPVEQITYDPDHSFEDFVMNDLLKRNLRGLKFTHPTQIQDKAIPIGLAGHDLIGVANTGTGKTAAFMLPLLNTLIANKGQKALIIAPTRELAMQRVQDSRSFSKGGQIFDVLLIGGVPIGPQLRDLKRNPQVFVGTPGRIKDHLERGSLRLDRVTTVVLDEVDRMLDMGFIKDIRLILGKLPEHKQSMYFSATINPTIDGLIKTFTSAPETIMAKTAENSDNVEQTVMHYYDKTDKHKKLHELLATDKVEKTLIFCETKWGSEKLSKELVKAGFTSDAMHGNKSQRQRQRALKRFRTGEVDILVATDVAARGIDVDAITHVINFDVPQTYDDYTHRIGRTGRRGNLGNAITFVTH